MGMKNTKFGSRDITGRQRDEGEWYGWFIHKLPLYLQYFISSFSSDYPHLLDYENFNEKIVNYPTGIFYVEKLLLTILNPILKSSYF